MDEHVQISLERYDSLMEQSRKLTMMIEKDERYDIEYIQRILEDLKATGFFSVKVEVSDEADPNTIDPKQVSIRVNNQLEQGIRMGYEIILRVASRREVGLV